MKRRLPYILGFEMPIERIEAKFKMGQDERQIDTRAAIDKLQDSSSRNLSDLMRRHSEKR